MSAFETQGLTIRIDDQITLRQLVLADAELMFDMVSRNTTHLRPWFRWYVTLTTLQAVRETLERDLAEYRAFGKLRTVIEVAGRPVGLAYTCEHNAQNDRVEIGYWLDQREQGNGYATRGCRGVIAYCFDTLNMNRIDILADVNNAPSRGVAERLGFTYEATLAQWLKFPDGRYVDMASYRLLRKDWTAGSPS